MGDNGREHGLVVWSLDGTVGGVCFYGNGGRNEAKKKHTFGSSSQYLFKNFINKKMGLALGGK